MTTNTTVCYNEEIYGEMQRGQIVSQFDYTLKPINFDLEDCQKSLYRRNIDTIHTTTQSFMAEILENEDVIVDFDSGYVHMSESNMFAFSGTSNEDLVAKFNSIVNENTLDNNILIMEDKDGNPYVFEIWATYISGVEFIHEDEM